MYYNAPLLYEQAYSITINNAEAPLYYFFDYDERSYNINMEFQHFHQFYEVHILLDVPAHHIHAELTGTVTAAQTVVTAPTSRMQDSDVESLVQLRKTIESIVQFVQTAAQSDDAASPAA